VYISWTLLISGIVILKNMFRLLIDRFEDSLQIAAGNLQTDQSHLERYFENSYKVIAAAITFYLTFKCPYPILFNRDSLFDI